MVRFRVCDEIMLEKKTSAEIGANFYEIYVKLSQEHPKWIQKAPKGYQHGAKKIQMVPKLSQKATKMHERIVARKKVDTRTLELGNRTPQKSTLWPKRSPQGSISEAFLVSRSIENASQNRFRKRTLKKHEHSSTIYENSDAQKHGNI